MKRFIFIASCSLLLLVALCPITSVHAQTATAAGQTAAAASNSNSSVSQIAGQVFTSALQGAGNLISGALGQLAYWILELVAQLLGFVGQIFNWAVVITVFQFGFYFANSQGMLTAWGIIRDLANIIILFAFIFVGVMMILDLHSFDARRTLPRLIIFAVLLNFSLFIGEAVVDVANVLSSELYLQAGSSTLQATNTSSVSGATSNNAIKIGIAGVILQEAGVSSVLNPPSVPKGQNGQALTVYMITTLLLLILMAVLLAGAIMLFTRAIMLAFLLLLSPIAFAGMAVPQLEGRANEWWNKLLANAFFAPIYLLLIFVGLKVMDATRVAIAGGNTNLNLMQAIINGNSSFTSVLIIYALIIGFMIAAFMFARSSGVAGAAFATSFAQKAVQNAVVRPITAPIRGAAGGGAWLARTAAGNAAQTGAHRYNELIGNLRKRGGIVGGIAKTADYMVGANIESAAHNIETAKIGGKSFQDDRNNEKARDKETAHAAEISHLNEELKSGDLSRMERASQQMPMEDLEKFIRQNTSSLDKLATIMSTDKFEKIMDSKELDQTTKDLVLEKRFATLHGQLGLATNSDGETKPFENFDKARGEVGKWANEDIAALAKYDPKTFDQLVGTTKDPSKEGGDGTSLISDDQYNALKGNKSLTKTQRTLLNSNTKGGQLIAAVTSNSDTEMIRKLANGLGTGIADQPNFVLKNESVIGTFDKSKMQNIGTKNKLSDAEKKEILDKLRDLNARGKAPNYAQIAEWLRTTPRAREIWGDIS